MGWRGLIRGEVQMDEHRLTSALPRVVRAEVVGSNPSAPVQRTNRNQAPRRVTATERNSNRVSCVSHTSYGCDFTIACPDWKGKRELSLLLWKLPEIRLLS